MSNNAQPTPNNDQFSVTRYVYKYHNDSITKLNFLLLGMVLLIVLFVLLMILQMTTKPKPIHFELNDKQQIIKTVPLYEEGISTAALLNVVNEFCTKAFSFNYSNIKKQNGKLEPYFSQNALKQYNDLLNNDEDFKNLERDQFVVSIVPTAAPEILVGKAFQDRYVWQIRVHANIFFTNALMRKSQEVELDLLIWRVDDINFPLGINVAAFNRKIISRSGGGRIVPLSYSYLQLK